MIVNRKANFFYKVLNILSVMASIDSSMFTQWNSSNPSLFESWHLACKLLLYHLVYITNCSQGILHCTVGDSSNKKNCVSLDVARGAKPMENENSIYLVIFVKMSGIDITKYWQNLLVCCVSKYFPSLPAAHKWTIVYCVLVSWCSTGMPF